MKDNSMFIITLEGGAKFIALHFLRIYRLVILLRLTGLNFTEILSSYRSVNTSLLIYNMTATVHAVT